ncbi:MAG: alanine racemase, partial [Abditibacteriota bacterium]|nr:alanine racemase [Abditibacteriota bacterium]
MIIKNKQKRVWAEIDLNCAEDNFRFIRSRIKPETGLCCVVKANGYGHGALQLASLYEKLGADLFAVSNIEEAIQLRNGGVSKPVLILGYTPVLCAKELAAYGLSQCVYSEEYGAALSECCVSGGIRLPVHIKLDTGMGRLGFRYRAPEKDRGGLEAAARVCQLPGLEPEGIFTHFAAADEGGAGADFTLSQYECFREACGFFAEKGIRFSVRHCSNSAAILERPEFQEDMVRAGIILYGLKPSPLVKNTQSLKPVMTLKSVISHIKTLQAGDTVSYGRTFTAPGPMKVATVPMGYA